MSENRISKSKKNKEGAYVYVISGKAKLEMPLEGAFGSPVERMDIEDISVFYSRINLREYSKGKIEVRFKEDIEWAKKNVLAHHNVIDGVRSATGNAIPIKFGVIYKSLEALKRRMIRERSQAVRVLADLNNKDEWDVKIFADHTAIASELLKKDAALFEEMRAMKEMTGGVGWFYEKRTERLAREKADDVIGQMMERVIRKIEGNVDRMTPISGLVQKEEDEEMVWHGAVLVNRKGEMKFLDNLKSFEKEEGWRVSASGPWPPYNFVEELKAPKGRSAIREKHDKEKRRQN